ncbi:FadR family transcriptional regulator [Streptosporangiaceae bacterium NEAU-GS5]|nr:FadR family transcriptional regulator [Streptosporangiaceae bacterium NEAU-GS5]
MAKAFEQVLARIEEAIATEGLKVGDRLPGERQLAEQLSVSRASVREALRALSTLGVVSSQVGRGPDAGAVLTSRPGAALAGLVRLNLGLDAFSMREVIGARLMIEQWAAVQAAHLKSGTAEMARAIDAMDRAAGPEEFVAGDIAFHLALVAAAGNRLTTAVLEALRASVHRYAIAAVVRLGDTSGLQEGHRLILRAVEDGDAGGAVTAVTAHLAYAYPE